VPVAGLLDSKQARVTRIGEHVSSVHPPPVPSSASAGREHFFPGVVEPRGLRRGAERIDAA
jgi:hypothetical protein